MINTQNVKNKKNNIFFKNMQRKKNKKYKKKMKIRKKNDDKYASIK
jgi:hypothetical protein